MAPCIRSGLDHPGPDRAAPDLEYKSKRPSLEPRPAGLERDS